MNLVARRPFPAFRLLSVLVLVVTALFGLPLFSQTLSPMGTSNSCPVDGCEVEIVSVRNAENGEYAVAFRADFTPQLSKNHIHIWWGENWKVTQVTANAMTVYNNPQGVYHPIDDYPGYTTKGVVSAQKRGDAMTLCVTAADRNHNILDPTLYNCHRVPR